MAQAGVNDDRPAAPPALGRDWWAPGMTLAERVRLAGPPERPALSSRLDRAARRFAGWRDSHELTEERFSALLAERGLEPATLQAMLAEDPADLAARARRSGRTAPGWATTVQAVLDAMPDVPTAHADAPTWQDGFNAIMAPFAAYAGVRFTDALPAAEYGELVDLDAVRRQMQGQLVAQLSTLAARTLVLELNVLRVQEKLAGDTPQDRFASFVAHLSTRAALTDLLAEYVVLARLLAQACENTVAAYAELVTRLAADRADIVATVFGGSDPGRLAEVVMGGNVGDAHQGGRSVGVLRFSAGALLVYKPRPMSVHVHVNDAIRWLSGRLPTLGLRTLTVLDRGGYGWVRFVHQEPCADRGGLSRFYRRQGALLALLHALGGADFHYENLIAGGEHPILVDMEGVLHPLLPQSSGVGWVDEDPARVALRESVVRVGLLPTLLWNDNGDALDLGGMGGDDGVLLPFASPNWARPATDEMRLVREHLTFVGSKNRPTVDGTPANPALYVTELVEGFRSGYEAIVAGRQELLSAHGLLASFADDQTRVVIRPTQLYMSLMIESTHPDVMRDALDRDRILHFLWAAAGDDPVRRHVTSKEIDDLWAGDIPIFTTRPSSSDLWCSDGSSVPDALERASLAHVTDRVTRMNPRDRAEQEWIIRASLATRPSILSNVAGVPAVDRERALDHARRIADQLADQAHHDDRRVNWLGMDLVDGNRWLVNPLRMELYNGIPGVALFLAQTAAVTGEERYAELARRALAPVPALVADLAELPADGPAPDCGPFSGFTGLAYALAHVGRLLDAPDLLECAGPLLDAVARGVEQDETLDVIGGAAGAAVAALAVHRATGRPAALKLALSCAERLLVTARPQPGGLAWDSTVKAVQPLAGFSHGAAGIGWALVRCSAMTPDPLLSERFLRTGLAGFGYERGLFDDTIKNWPDYRDLPDRVSDGTSPPHMHTWCHGAPGIGLARADLLARNLTDDRAVAADLDLALASFLATPPTEYGHSLCHGELGNLELLAGAIAAGHTELAGEHARRTNIVLDQLSNGPRCGTPAGVPSPGLMTGLAGIGYGLLRQAVPERVPSVLLLDPPIETAFKEDDRNAR